MDTQVGTEVNTEVTQVERDPTEEWEVGQVSAFTGVGKLIQVWCLYRWLEVTQVCSFRQVCWLSFSDGM